MACAGTNLICVALAPDPEMHHALTALHVLDSQPAQLLAAHAVIEQGGQDDAIAHALERVAGRCLQELARLGVAERRRRRPFPVRSAGVSNRNRVLPP